MTSRWLQIFLLFILPVLLLLGGIIRVGDRFLLAGAVLASLLTIIIREQWTLSDLGLRRETFFPSILPYSLFTVIGMAFILITASVLGREPVPLWWTKSYFAFFFLPLSIVQEFAYRGFLAPRLQSMFHSTPMAIVANTILFTFVHTIYPNPLYALPLAFFAGLGFSMMYIRYPNLILISLSHAVLNFVVVLYGLIGFSF